MVTESSSLLGGWKLKVVENSCDCKSYSIHRARLTSSCILFNRLTAVLWVILSFSVTYSIASTRDIGGLDNIYQAPILHYVLIGVLAIFGVRIIQYLHICEETVMVVRGFGIQVTTTSSSGSTSTQLYPAQHIHSLIINEGITMHQIIFYLALVLKDHSGSITSVQPLFMSDVLDKQETVSPDVTQ